MDRQRMSCIQRRCIRSCLGAREKESPRLMHVIVLHCALYLFWGAASVSEWGVLVWKEDRSGVRKDSCD